MGISITLDAKKKHPVSPSLYGIFYEDINFSCDGGINANMVMNYSFEGVFLDRETDRRVVDLGTSCLAAQRRRLASRRAATRE